MRVWIALTLAAAAVVIAHAANTPTASCSVSGDPHFITFDKFYYDFQGKGWFQVVQSSSLNIQAEFQPVCNGEKVTCTRQTIVKVSIPNGDSFILKWGAVKNVADSVVFQYFRPTPRGSPAPIVSTTVDLSDPVNTLAAAIASVSDFANGLYKVTYNKGKPGSLVIQAVCTSPCPSAEFASVTLSQYSIAVVVPQASFQGSYPATTLDQIKTNGLCGRYDGQIVAEMTARDQFTAAFVLGASQSRVTSAQNTDLYNWGLTWAVGAGGIPSLLSGPVHDASGKVLYVLQTPELATVPDSTDQAALMTVPFNDVAALGTATTFCNQLLDGTGYSTLVKDFCMYDAAYAGDLSLAATNVITLDTAAALSGTTTTTSSSSSSDGTTIGLIVGLTIGCVAAVAIVVSMVLYIRLKKVKEDYSRALILRNQAGTGPTGSSTDVHQFNHAENL